MKKNIAIITGTRAEFGIWTPILHALASSGKLRPQLLVTGMHLQRQFGHTIDDIKKSGIPIAATAEMYKPRDTPADSLARGTQTIARTLQKLKPDLVMLLGDRLEMLAAADAALTLQLPIAHLHGGETAPGVWDEQIRHAITKLAHLHFPATETARRRIERMGENPKNIHLIGAPALDLLGEHWKLVGPIASKIRGYRPPGKRSHAAVLILHPTGDSPELERQRAADMLRALEQSGVYPETLIGPNNDPGHEGILQAYRDAGVPVEMNLDQTHFWSRVAYASFLIGNSSAGIIEAASFGIPVINLGHRQKGRERNPNVLDVPWSAGAAGIRRAIHHALTNKKFRATIAKRKNLYGDGHASERLVKFLEALKFPLPTTKQFHD